MAELSREELDGKSLKAVENVVKKQSEGENKLISWPEAWSTLQVIYSLHICKDIFTWKT